MRSTVGLLDKGSPVPLYYQLYLRLQTEIQAGVARPGDLLGTEKDLGEQYGVSRATVRKALDELARTGRLVRVTGRGTFVAEPALHVHTPHLLSLTEELQRRGIVAGSRVLAFATTAALPEVATALGCRSSDPVLHIRRLRTADGIPMVLVDHYLAPSIPLCRENLGQSLYSTLEVEMGIRLPEAYHTVRAGTCTAEEAALLQVPEASVVLRFERTTFNADSRPVIYEQGLGCAHLYDYSVHLYRQASA